MAPPPSSLLGSLFLLLCVLSAFVSRAIAADLGIYWGWEKEGTTLRETCDTGNFKIVNLAFLERFGNGTMPQINFGTACDAESNGCRSLQSEIEHCQSSGIKVLLSVGGRSQHYTLVSDQDARNLAEHLYRVYLSDDRVLGPLGRVKLDGIDLYIRDTTPHIHHHFWATVARALKNYDEDIILSASPTCHYSPEIALSKALRTGLFDKIWPRFYLCTGCEYDRKGHSEFEQEVQTWTSTFNADFYVGLPADSNHQRVLGYLSPEALRGALQAAAKYPGYAGVMLWNRNWDVRNDYYSDKISPIVDASPKNPRIVLPAAAV